MERLRLKIRARMPCSTPKLQAAISMVPQCCGPAALRPCLVLAECAASAEAQESKLHPLSRHCVAHFGKYASAAVSMPRAARVGLRLPG
jgi:hypothetical protein